MNGWGWTLVILGAVLEFAGILVIAWPDFAPWTTRFGAWLKRTTRRFRNAARRLIGLAPLSRTHQIGTATEEDTAGRVYAIRTPPASATLEERVDLLVKLSVEAQQRIGPLESRMDEVEAELAAMDERMTAIAQDEALRLIAASKEEDRPLRIFGTVLLALGLILQVPGALVG